MESKRMNFSRILKSAIAGIGFSLACLIIGIFAVLPFKTVNAEDNVWSRSALEQNNISFIAAKTKVKTADNYVKEIHQDNKENNYNAYVYTYIDETSMNYYSTSKSYDKLDNYSSASEGFGNNSLYYNDNGNQYINTFDALNLDVNNNTIIQSSNYIPSNAEYFFNSTTNKIEEVFYDKAAEGDFVLLDNYNSHNVTSGTFDVENFYISFGSKPEENDILLDDLEVEAYLYKPTEVHQLNINNNAPIEYKDSNENNKNIYYFSQFLDLRNIQGKKTGDISSTYDIKDQQGKYVFIFNFSAYNKVTETAVGNGTFVFTFYLIDNAVYNTYPVINTNNNNEYIAQNELREYYYNYNTDAPTITYNPTQINLSYTRDDVDNVTSEYTSGTYTHSNGKDTNFPREEIVFKNNGAITKRLYILTYYNDLKNTMEHLYLSSKNTVIPDNASYETYTKALEDELLDFEYKISKQLVVSTNAQSKNVYTINTYKTVLTENYAWGDKDNNTIINSTSYTEGTAINEINTNTAKNSLNPNEIPVEIEYEITFDDLGVYTFNYDYVIVSSQSLGVLKQPTVISQGRNVTYTNSTTSTNKLTPEKAGLSYTKTIGDPTTEISNSELVIKSWAYLKSDNTVTLNGEQFIYYPTNNKLNNIDLTNNTATINNSPIPTDNKTPTLGGLKVKTTYKILELTDGNILEIHYTVGKYSKSRQEVKYRNESENITKTITTTTHTYSLDFNIDTFSNDEEWSTIKALLEYLNKGSYVTANTDYEVASPNMSGDILHMFGSMSYFNLKDGSGNKAKLKQIDIDKDINFVSDVTKYYNEVSKPTAGFSTKISGLENMIITTDKGPITWKNLSSLLYNGKNSQSYVYRYSSYTFKTTTDGGVTTTQLKLGTPEVSAYTKDMQIEYDGLYEIIVKYNYDLYKHDYNKAEQTEFYQLFTFIIDNSSPTLNIKIDGDEDGNYDDSLPTHKFTNKKLEISWTKPTYFQNDIYINIQKTSYTSNTIYNYTAKYSQGSTTLISGGSGISDINKLITNATIEDEDVYRVRLDADSAMMNGNYKISLHCGINGAAATSKEFTIDKENIDGTKVLPIIQNTNGTYSVNTTADYYTNNSTSQIINFDFTFRYNPKASGASITTYWHKINLNLTDDYDEIVNTNDGTGITINYEVDGETSIQSGNKYSYNYATDKSVSNNNIFTNTNSAIYLFTLVDQAGNECRYVIFYDTTTPRFLITPTLTNSNNIVNNTTQITWGDYKAIKINTDLKLENNGMDNYSDFTGNKIQEALNYIFSNGELFNDTEVIDINNSGVSTYYLFLPISEVKVSDITAKPSTVINGTTYSNSITYTGDVPNNYYLFAKDPLMTLDGTTNRYTQISLPVYVDNKLSSTVTKDITNHIDYAVEDFDGDQILRRFISTTGTVVNGAIGEGEFEFQVYDKQRNLTSGYLWMNFDKTQTLAYGIFNNKDTQVQKATALTGEEGSYSASKLFISSLEPSGTVPNYSLTYKFYEYNDDLYEVLLTNYNISSVSLLSASSTIPEGLNLTITGAETYLLLSYAHKTSGITKFVTIQITDEIGNNAPKHSYPYDLEGTAIVSDANGPQHIYSKYSSSYTLQEDTETRLFTSVINPVSDEKQLGNIVTEEGLYIFKRTYTKNEGGNYTDANGNVISDLGEDDVIVYRIYYIDRTGIINVATTNAIAATLYEQSAQNFGFVLGSSYTDETLKKYVNSTTIQNNESPYSQNSNYSNTNNISQDLFVTNKVQVQFNITADKYNFKAFDSAFYDKMISKVAEGDQKIQIIDYLDTYLFNGDYYSEYLYKIDLTLEADKQKIIDESSDDSTKIYNQSAITNYLQGTAQTNGKRNNSFNMFRGTYEGNVYSAILKDNSGYRKFSDTNSSMIESNNYLANQLEITFNISHEAPTGDTYGKYYGRHDYDENRNNNANPSIPLKNVTDESTYRLLSEYLKEGQLQLQPLSSNEKSSTNSVHGKNVTLFSTNNETLIFTFAINPDDYMAQIDPSDITIYKDGQIIFKVDGTYVDAEDKVHYNFVDANSIVSADRMSNAYIWNNVNGIMYYAVIIFDNNLDEILDADEEEYKKYRLLDPNQNSDSATYSVNINYVGDSNLYVDDKNSYSNTTYSITIDRIKPTYNLTKLMELDKYVYNTVTTPVSTSNYSEVFNQYAKFYYPTSENGLQSPILDNYFFAVDYRPGSAFKWESVSDLDATKGIYIRKVDINSYKYSKTPDDYRTYYDATTENPQFTPINATIITNMSQKIDSNYYYLPYSLSNNNYLSLASLVDINNNGILELNSYYEVIETDEAGNYRVYGIYVPNYTNNKISYTYKANADSVETPGSINYNDNSLITINGIDFKLSNYITDDYFIRASIQVKGELIYINYDPKDLCVYIKDKDNKILNVIENVQKVDHITGFVTTINNLINDYKTKIEDKNGYTLVLTIMDRLGLSPIASTSQGLKNYVFTYNVAGDELTPVFNNYTNYFTITIPAKTGTTNITKVRAYIFKNGWSPKDPDDRSNSFYKSEEELLNGFTYTLGKGVYKFEITDNFNRTSIVFYEFGTTTTQSGGTVRYYSNKISHTDGYTYTSNLVDFIYDSTIYNIYIAYAGETSDGQNFPEDSSNRHIIYSNNSKLTEEELRSLYGISITSLDGITTVTMSGVKDLSKYYIKTIPASIVAATNYKWGDELTNTDILVYDNKVAIYTPIQTPIVKNLNGIELEPDTDNKQLILTDDAEVTMVWKNVAYENQIDFNSHIELTRKYTENDNVKKDPTLIISDKYTITKPGFYTAVVVNALGNRSKEIEFTRGDGEITMYTVYTYDTLNKVNTKLTPSTIVNKEPSTDENSREIIVFNYYTTDDYFSFKGENGKKLTLADLETPIENIDTISIDRQSPNKKYLDVIVNGNLNIEIKLHAIGIDATNNNTPFAQFRIFSIFTNNSENGSENESENENESTKIYTYRFLKIYFLPSTDYSLVDTSVTTELNTTQNILGSSNIIKRPDNNLLLRFSPNTNTIDGNTLYISRYYNNQLIETITHTDIYSDVEFLISDVGLHTFIVKDLAGRVQTFGDVSKNTSGTYLQIYLINQIIFTVNGETPINNQYFNGDVTIEVISELAGLTLYDTLILGIDVYKDGKYLDDKKLTFTDPGYYSVKLSTNTRLATDGSQDVTNQQIFSTYNFTILKENIAKSSFTVSKGDGFEIEKIIKVVNDQNFEVTELHKNTDSLLLLTHEKEGNSKFVITLKKYDSAIKDYRMFTFNVWINNESPIILSNIAAGAATKDTITLNFNPGKIYEQVGKAYIKLNNSTYTIIDENSENAVKTITITEKGTYVLEIVSEDGRVFSSYKFQKKNPINKTTQIVLVCIGIGAVVLVALFFLVRRKGKYR